MSRFIGILGIIFIFGLAYLMSNNRKAINYMKENINSKIILVTGASRGIGRAIAEELSKENIVIANYNKS